MRKGEANNTVEQTTSRLKMQVRKTTWSSRCFMQEGTRKRNTYNQQVRGTEIRSEGFGEMGGCKRGIDRTGFECGEQKQL
jgi:hypothetical protein